MSVSSFVLTSLDAILKTIRFAAQRGNGFFPRSHLVLMAFPERLLHELIDLLIGAQSLQRGDEMLRPHFLTHTGLAAFPFGPARERGSGRQPRK